MVDEITVNNPENMNIELHRSLGRIEGKLDAMALNQEHLLLKQDEMDTRIGTLEKKNSYFLGVAAVVSGAVVLAINFLSKYIHFGSGGTP